MVEPILGLIAQPRVSSLDEVGVVQRGVELAGLAGSMHQDDVIGIGHFIAVQLEGGASAVSSSLLT